VELLHGLIESVDGRGYRGLDDADWSKFVDPPAAPEELARAEAELAKLDPPGAGARNAVDAMLRQLSPADSDRPLIERILGNHLDDLARHRRGVVASALEVSPEELDLLLEKIRRLAPRPGAGFDDEPTIAVRPDLIVRRAPSGIDLAHVDLHAIPLEIDPQVLAASRDRSTPAEIRNYLRERIDAAKCLLQCLDQRRATLERVARALFLRQPAFLERGPKFVRPLRMHELAEALSIHPSTISRAVAGKYAETEWGIFRLRDFFEVGVATTTGEAGSRSSLREAIRQLFAEEDRARPLDDDAVVERLRARGYVLARRTVAKYRAELGIPSSWHRRARGAPASQAARGGA
jgi:RNA polymerase sigma-54 factor